MESIKIKKHRRSLDPLMEVCNMSENLIEKMINKLAQFFGAEQQVRRWLSNECRFDLDAIGIFRSNDLVLDLSVCDEAKKLAVYTVDYSPLFVLMYYPDGRITTRGSSPVGW